MVDSDGLGHDGIAVMTVMTVNSDNSDAMTVMTVNSDNSDAMTVMIVNSDAGEDDVRPKWPFPQVYIGLCSFSTVCGLK